MARHRRDEPFAIDAPQLEIALRSHRRHSRAVLEQRDVAEVPAGA
jgi:hypothetical protein